MPTPDEQVCTTIVPPADPLVAPTVHEPGRAPAATDEALIKTIVETPASASAGAPAPATIGRYVLERELGRGGMGVVYRAFDPALRRAVAIKRMLAPLGPKGGEAGARFEREARTAALLRHPGIVTVFEVGEQDGLPYLVLELIEGESLEELLAREQPSPRRVAELVREVALALQHAHEHGIVHRDVKPHNVLVDRQGRAHVMDFGLARDVADLERLTVTGQLLGTPGYMAPEQARADGAEQGPACDVYSLGVVLYRAIAHELPFRAGSLQALIRKVLEEEPRALRTLRPEVPRDLETITLRCLEKEPARRYASAGALADDLRRFREGEPILARRPSLAGRALRWAGKNRRLAVPVVAVALTVVLGRYEVERRAEQQEVRRVGEQRAALQDAIEVARSGRWETASEADFAAATHAVAALVEPATSGVVAGALDALALELRAGSRDALLSVEALTPDERAAGLAPIESLEAAVDRWLDRAPGAAADPDAARVVEQACERLDARRPGDRSRQHEHEAALREAQARRLGPGGPWVARLLCAALALVGTADDLVFAALARDLQLEQDEGRAVRVAETLCRLRGREAEARRLVVSKSDELPSVSFSDRAARFLPAATGVEPSTWRDHLELARARTRAGDDRGAIAALSSAIALAPDQAGPRVARGLSRLATGDLPGARADLDRACALAPGDAAALALRGSVRARQGDDEGGIADCTSAIAMAERAPLVWALRGAIHAARHEPDLATSDCARALDLDARCVEALVTRARAAIDQRAFDAARTDCTRALEADARSVTACATRARALLELGDFEGAAQDCERALRLDPECALALADRSELHAREREHADAIADAERAVALAPDLPAAWLARAQARGLAGDPAQAVADATKALALDPRWGWAFHVRGSFLQALGRLREAEADLTRAIEREPRLAKYRETRATIREELHDARGALADHDEALRLDPADAAALNNRGALKQELGDGPGAILDFSRAIESTPGYSRAWGNRAHAELDQGDAKAALADATHALELDPRFRDAFITRGRARYALGDVQGALDDAIRVTELDPSCAAGWSDRAFAHYDLHDVQAAIADLTTAITVGPGDAQVWGNRGQLRGASGDSAGAVQDYTRSLELEPRQAQLLRLRGLAHQSLGETAEAIADLERFLRVAPGDRHADEVRASLAKLRPPH